MGIPSGHQLFIQAAPPHFQLPISGLEKAAAGCPGTWDPATDMGDMDKVPDSWHLPGPALAHGVTWEMNHRMKDFALSQFSL